MYNAHIHIFKDEDVPEKFLPLHLVRILSTKIGFAIIGRVLNMLNPFSSDDLFDRYKKFITIGKLGSQKKIFEECQKFYPKNTKFIVLPMDMAYMSAGRVPRQYANQLNELADLKDEYGDVIIPFIHVDPRRPDSLNRVIKYVETRNFGGVKIYPPLGYFPYDERLYPIYEYCEKNQIPIISHCSPYNPVHFKGSKKELKELLSKSKTPIDTKGKSDKELCSNFTNPSNWEYVMKDFPNLKICLAHFGSEYYWDRFLDNPKDSENWLNIIVNMLSTYKNLYTDISFTMNNTEYFSLLKLMLYEDDIKNKILFGTDYYMVETEATENRFILDLREYLGNDLFKLISEDNTNNFISKK